MLTRASQLESCCATRRSYQVAIQSTCHGGCHGGLRRFLLCNDVRELHSTHVTRIKPILDALDEDGPWPERPQYYG